MHDGLRPHATQRRLSRRDFFESAMAASAAGGLLFASSALSPAGAHADGAMKDAALKGAAYFRGRAADQLRSLAPMVSAIQARDLAAARAAYVDARPEYEEIEVLAASFAQSDSDIDARPYAFAGGETSPDFRGFHKVEYLLFRDDDLDLARQYAERLVASVTRLEQELGEPDRFTAVGTFEGMIGLAEEIGSKKISSEEETWSDQSVVIFKFNFIGINSQYQPFAAMLTEKSQARADAVNAAYQAARASVQDLEGGAGVAMVPYSRVTVAQRKVISDATYAYRDSLIAAAETLGVFA